MDKWEFFQDIKGAWVWRRTSADGRATTTSTESYRTRVGAVYDAKTRGYTEYPAKEQSAMEETIVSLKALSDVVSTPEGRLRRSGYNPYDTAPENLNPKPKR